MRILHLALPADWERARANGSHDVSTRGISLVEAGFIHACTLTQLPGVLERFYRDVPEVDLLVIDIARLEHEGARVLWEDVPNVDDGPYPHIYGVIPTQTVRDVVRLRHQPGAPWPTVDLPDIAAGP